MRATLMYGPGDVRVEDIPDSVVHEPTEALVRVTTSCICGSDLHPYHSMNPADGPARMGHEFIGVVEETGSDVSSVRKGDLVVAPFAFSDGTCEFCREGLHTSCVHGGFWDMPGMDGGQAEAVRVPLADGTLFRLPVEQDSALMPSLLTLSDVYGTGYHAAVRGGVNERTAVTVIGDGAVGLLAVLSAKQLGAEQIILMGRHKARTDMGREFGATDVVEERGDEGIARVKELTGGLGAHSVIEAVGTQEAMMQAIHSTRPGGHVGFVGVSHDVAIPGDELFMAGVHIHGGPAPVRQYLPRLVQLIWDRTIDPGKVFDLTLPLDEAAKGYRAMDQRSATKVLLTL
jgi:threonine dehydrogenase-like Zn-dependent dehydrogenase